MLTHDVVNWESRISMTNDAPRDDGCQLKSTTAPSSCGVTAQFALCCVVSEFRSLIANHREPLLWCFGEPVQAGSAARGATSASFRVRYLCCSAVWERSWPQILQSSYY